MREEFDLEPGLLYLNSGTHSIVPRPVLEAVSRHRREYERNPTAGLIGAWERVWKVQERLASFVGADPRDLFLRANVTEAMNAFILGMPLPEDGEILLSDAEYGAIDNACLLRARRDGLTVRRFHLPTDRRASAAGLTETVTSALGPKTRLLVLSHVTTGAGLVLPVAEIARVARERGVLLAVDGAHAIGALPLDFRAIEDVDFYGTNLHKWLLGPKGTGLAWVPRRHQEALRPLEGGWGAFETTPELGAFGGGSRFAVRMLPVGCRDFAPLLALEETLAFWDRHGAGRIRERLRALRARVEAEMSALGWPCLSPAEGTGLRGPLTTYELPARLEAEGTRLMERLLREEGLQVAVPRQQGRFRLRLSPHVYNTEDEIASAARILSRA